MIFAILFVKLILFYGFVGSNKIVDPNTNIDLVSSLRKNGKLCLTNKNYSQAIQYYSAILQIVEGLNGEDYLEIRRRSALTLAECENRLGNLKKAIARYSEVINEAPTTLSIMNQSLSDENDSTNFDNEISRSIGKALYKRGLSLKRMKMPYFALLDLEESLKYVPDNIEVYQEIANLEILDEIKYIKSNQTDSILRDEHNDLIEECQLNYPRIELNKNELNKLKTYNPIHIEQQLSSIQQIKNPFDSLLSNNNINMNKGLDTNNPFSNIGNLLGNLNGLTGSNSNNQNGILGMLPLLGSLAGLDNKTITNISDIILAIQKVYEKFKNMLQLLQKNKQIIIMVLTFIWIIYCFK